MSEAVRIALHDYCGHPFQVELSRTLAARGNQVLHLYCPSVTSGRGALALRDGDPPTFAVEGVALDDVFDRYRPQRRLAQELRYARRLISRLAAFGPEVIVSANTPLLAQARLARWCRARHVGMVFWQQDVLSAGTGLVLARRSSLLGRLAGTALHVIESRALNRSDAVVAITEDFLPALRRLRVPPEKVTVIENWAPVREIPPTPRDNAWRREVGLGRDVVFLYSGTLGLKHDPGLLASLAGHLRGRARVVVVSEGIGADWLMSVAADRQLDNLLVLPFQPWERMPEVLGAADVLVAVLERDAGVFSVPSKVLSYLCAGRPILAAIPGGNLASRVLERAGAGLRVEPGDLDGFLGAATRLADDVELRRRLGRSGRLAAERWFDIEDIASRFEDVIVRVAEGGKAWLDTRASAVASDRASA